MFLIFKKWRSGAKSCDYYIKGGSNEDYSWKKKRKSVLNDKPHLQGELLFLKLGRPNLLDSLRTISLLLNQ